MTTVPMARNTRSIDEELERLYKLREEAKTPGSEQQLARRREQGRLSARERIGVLLDPGSFTEIGQLMRPLTASKGSRPFTDGVVTGWGTIDGRRVCVSSQDFTVLGGSLGKTAGMKIRNLVSMARMTGVPYISLNDGAGARLQEGVASLGAYGGIFSENVTASGRVPQISVILGPCAGGAAYSPALMDFTFMVRGQSLMFITGPSVIAEVTGEKVDASDLGGATMHSTRSGVADFAFDDEVECLEGVRDLLAYLPSNNEVLVPTQPCGDVVSRECGELEEIVPGTATKSYDVRQVVETIVDWGDYLEVARDWARNVVCCFARLDGRVVGVVANQPAVLAGVLDIAASEKAAHFVRTCDAFNIPLLALVDTPGFLPGRDQEEGGIIRHGSKLAYAFCEASVPKVQLIMRKAYGGAYIVMNSRSVGADFTFAWPVADIAVMGPEAAYRILYGDREHQGPERERAVEEIRRTSDPFCAVEAGVIDEVIEPRHTRYVLIRAMNSLCTDIRLQYSVERSHGNIRF